MKEYSLPFRVFTGYLLFAALWALLSYAIISHIAYQPDTAPFVYVACGVLFVLSSAGLIYGLVALNVEESSKIRSRLKVSVDTYRALVDSAPLAVVLFDRNGIIRYANFAAATMVGASDRALLIGQSVVAFGNPSDADAIHDWISQILNGDTSLHFEALPFRRIDGSSGTGQFSAVRFSYNGRWVVQLLAVDITEKVQAQRALAEGQQLYEALTELSPVGIYRADADGRCTYVNECWCDITGLKREEALENGWTAALHPDDRPAVVARWAHTVRHRTNGIGFYRFLRRDGTIRWVYGIDRAQLDDNNQLVGFIGTVTDITDRRTAEEALERAEQQLERLAYYDPLTGLPNRSLLYEVIGQSIEKISESQRCVSLLILEVYGFSEINHALGYDHGDRLLKDVAQRIQSSLREEQLVAKVGASVFAVLTPDLRDQSEAILLARELIKTVESSTVVGEIPMDIRLYAGLATYPDHADSPKLLFRRAEIAKAVAKRSRPELEVYHPVHEVDPERVALIAQLRQAIEARELFVVYQPKVSLKSGLITDVEALVRWKHPRKGLIQPSDFIPVAERTGLIGQITRYVLEVALTDARRWRTVGLNVAVCVNISARELYEPGFAFWVKCALQNHSTEPSRVTLELTETLVMEEPERSIEVLRELHKMGLQISVDDFGTGYSSLAYLKRLPIDELKIDGSFVQNMTNSNDDALIVKSTIGLAHQLGLRVTAEGVEDALTFEELKRQGCDTAQGFGIAKPMPADALQEWAIARITKNKN